MKNSNLLASASTLVASFAITVAMATPAMAIGDYLRKEKDIINVFVKDGKLFCNRAEDKFEMCHGMVKEGDDWKGREMKHPDMPGFMTFNGTVTITDTNLTIKGCAVGNSMCDTEVWTKIATPPAAEGAENGGAAETKPAASE